MFRYAAEDEDELSLEVGDIVQVTEYEDPEEQVLLVTNTTKKSDYLCCSTGGRLADGHQGVDGTPGTLPSQLHPSDLRCWQTKDIENTFQPDNQHLTRIIKRTTANQQLYERSPIRDLRMT